MAAAVANERRRKPELLTKWRLRLYSIRDRKS